MRTARVLLVVGLLLVAAPGHPMPDPGPAEVRYERGAFAMFTFQDGGDETFPFVAALAFGYTVDGGTERLWGAFVKGNCERDRGDGWVSIGCSGRSGVAGRLRNGEFQMDPAAQGASLAMTKGGERYKVTWAADGSPGVYQSSEWCFSNGNEEPDGEGHGGGIFQDAIAQGSAFGRKLGTSKRWIDHASMDEGGMLTQCTWLSSDDLDALRAGRYEDVTFRFTSERSRDRL